MEAIALTGYPVGLFDESYEALFAELTRLCRALGAGARSEDVAQDALVYARRHLAALRDPTRLRPWVRRMAARGATRARLEPAGRGVERVFAPLDPDFGIDAAAAIARLPVRERQIVVLVYGLGYPQDEAAEMLGIRRGTVGAALWKARQRLARELVDYRGEGHR